MGTWEQRKGQKYPFSLPQLPNTKNTGPLPAPQKAKRLDPSRLHAEPSHWLHETFSYFEAFHNCFQTGVKNQNSDLPDSNQRPKDHCTSTVLRSTN